MTITIMDGDIFKSGAEALVNPVNCVGVSGAGLAKVFAERYPKYQMEYEEACDSAFMRPGRILVVPKSRVATSEMPAVVYFPTKVHWKDDSKLIDIAKGLDTLRMHCLAGPKFKSVAIPALGCGLGGLDWDDVQKLIEMFLRGVRQDILVYPPYMTVGRR